MTADVDAEQEVDFGRLGRRVLARWWLPVGGLILGLAVGYLLSLGGGKVYRAEALVALGTPFTQNGTPLQGLTSNPRVVNEVINSENAIRIAAAKAGLTPAAIRGHVSLRTVGSGIPGRQVGPQVVGISVKGSRPAKVAVAADSLSNSVIKRTGKFVQAQIDKYNANLESINARLTSLGDRIDLLQKAIDEPGLAPLQQLLLVSYLDNAEQRQGTLNDDKSNVEQQLLLAGDIEKPAILSPPVAVQTTARSRHNSMAVGGLIGLLLGLIAALLWDWVAGRMNRASAV